MTVSAHAAGGQAGVLRETTRAAHAALDARMMAAEPFRDRERYGRYLCVQRQFFERVDDLYRDEALAAWFPDLPHLSRLAAVDRDLADLGLAPPASGGALQTTPAKGLGWLYVAEGSRLGGAMLAKETAALGFGGAFGARHLAPPPQGLGLAWNAFRRGLDAAPLTGPERAEVVGAALDAFAFVHRAVETAFDGQAQ